MHKEYYHLLLVCAEKLCNNFSIPESLTSHTEITLSQPCNRIVSNLHGCDNLVLGLSAPYKVVATLSPLCNRIVNLLHTGHMQPCFKVVMKL